MKLPSLWLQYSGESESKADSTFSVPSHGEMHRALTEPGQSLPGDSVTHHPGTHEEDP